MQRVQHIPSLVSVTVLIFFPFFILTKGSVVYRAGCNILLRSSYYTECGLSGRVQHLLSLVVLKGAWSVAKGATHSFFSQCYCVDFFPFFILTKGSVVYRAGCNILLRSSYYTECGLSGRVQHLLSLVVLNGVWSIAKGATHSFFSQSY